MAIDYNKVFEKAVESEGEDYLNARDQLIIAPNGLDYLRQEAMNVKWERALTARIVTGWRTNAVLYDKANQYIDGKISGPLPATGEFGIHQRVLEITNLGKDVVPRLVEAVWKTKEYQDDTRVGTVFAALQKLDARDAILPLRLLMDSKTSESYRGRAIATLGHLRDKDSATAFKNIASNHSETDYIRNVAITAYVDSAKDSASPLLIELLLDTKNPLSVRDTAASLLVYQEDDRIRDVFHHVLKGKPDEELQKTIIDGLGRHGDKESMQLLEDLMQTTVDDATKMIIEDSIDSIRHQ